MAVMNVGKAITFLYDTRLLWNDAKAYLDILLG